VVNEKRISTYLRYLTVFLVPIISFTTLYMYNDLSVTKKTTEEYYISLLSQVQSDIDFTYSKFENVALHMSSNEEILNLLQFDNIEQTKILSTYEKNLPEHMTLLYFPKKTTSIYYKESLTPYSVFENSSAYDSALTKAGLFFTLNSVDSKKTITFNSTSIYSAATAFPVPMISSKPLGTVCFLISKSFFNTIDEKYFSSVKHNLFVLDANHSLIYTREDTGLFNPSDLSRIIKSNKIGSSVINKDKERFVIFRSVSSNEGLNYIFTIPYDEFYSQQINNYRNLMYLIILLIVFSILMAAVLTKSVYKRVSAVEKKHDKTSHELQLRNDVITQMVLMRLINGTISDNDHKTLEYNLKCANLVFAHTFFTVVVINLENLQFTLDEINNFIVAFETLCSDSKVFYCVFKNEENQFAIIINHNDKLIDRSVLLKDLYDFFRKQVTEHLTIGCGQIYDNPFSIDTSYIEALASIQEKMNRVSNNMFLFHQNAVAIENFVYPYAEQAIIEQSILNGSCEIAIQSIRSVFSKIDQIAPSFIIQKCLHFDMVNMLVKISSSLSIPINTCEISKLSFFEDFTALRVNIERIIITLSEDCKAKQKKNRESTKRAIIEFAQNHFCENELSLNQIAEEFNLSYTYISKIFKDETGYSFLTYITRLRFDYIKYQLVNSDNSIKDIIISAGYLDIANFMRKFKQNEKITLGQYRQINKKN
jgi:two-component system, response regulator YesN